MPAPSFVFFQYPKCSTCRRAQKWLEGNGIEVRSVDIVQKPPSQAQLKLALKAGIPLPRLFNTSGVSYREGGFKERLKTMTEKQALAALVADGKLVKRPLLLGPGVALVGFKEGDWQASLVDA